MAVTSDLAGGAASPAGGRSIGGAGPAGGAETPIADLAVAAGRTTAAGAKPAGGLTDGLAREAAAGRTALQYVVLTTGHRAFLALQEAPWPPAEVPSISSTQETLGRALNMPLPF